MERAPSSLYFDCKECEEETRHRVLKGRYEGKKSRILNVVVECTVCGLVREETIKDKKEAVVTIMISDGGLTSRSELILGEDDPLAVGKEIYTSDGLRNIITSLEVGGVRRQRAHAGEVEALWVKRMEEVVVKISVNKGGKTLSRSMEMHYDEEVGVGDLISIDNGEAVVHRIKTDNRIVYDGSARAEEIVRVYARMVRKRWS